MGVLATAIATLALAVPSGALAQDAALPDEGYVAPPPVEYEHDSLTLDGRQTDPPAAGREYVLGASAAPDAVAVAGASAAPSGLLPFTGARTTAVLIGGVALLWAGVMAYAFAGASTRDASRARP